MSDKKRRKSGSKAIVKSAAVRVPALPVGYQELLADLKQRIHTAQIKAALSANRELILLYWDIGKTIVERQKIEGWGKSVVEHLSADLKKEFPDMDGFSARNIWRTRAFYLAWTEDIQILQPSAGELKQSKLTQPASEFRKTKLSQPVMELDNAKLTQLVSEIPWGHNIILFQRIKFPAERLWYVRQTLEHGWSRAVLEHQIESGLYERQGKAVTNFDAALPPPQSDLARQTLKDPYVFDFLTIDSEARERELHRDLVTHIRDFLIELGAGFAYVGSEYHLEVGDKDYYIDLLFYHLKLRSYVAVELKTVEFEPEFAGKMNFYLSAIDDILRQPDDQQSIGIIICKKRDRITAEYALRNVRTPIGVSRYQITRALPKRLKSTLPSIEELEAELRGKDF
ncbi:MAG TPA: PDDEXK nuclease domain-containing protein [bacterium]|nr:PDDEXK nuclease domain-containing protein [bacterium]HPN94700.1 PDDEXK nuclease domain-containing protein [bacterium]